ncbi:outer membrane lipid asymmetry maintenance protein MlaD [Acidisphaera sp. L21]|jgi:phospholipid/cholesterol/gamma-HCH transport system substrate-binding protein|uniref:outer membrane lipid asymmetry maintenance protein MlaD n=1 Tax=Acidisphaera sp. L21 TaxID=1641851 RepID=UPI00131DB496|nr:outer membrane lipid asymmetry maintenance protein MlaD [Acidisphaera sp. L21]
MARRSAAEIAAGAVVLLVAVGFLSYAVANTGRTGLGGYSLHAAFDNVGGISSGADVRIAGLKVGSVTNLQIDPKSYQAVATFTVQSDIKLSSDSSATIATGGLLGGNFISLATGGDEKMLADGGTITVTQSAVNLEDLLGKFIFNVGNLAEAAQKQMDTLKKTTP